MQKNDIHNFVKKLGIEKINKQKLEIQLLLLTKDFEIFRTNIDKNMKSDLIDTFLKPIWRMITEDFDKGLEIRAYDPQNIPDHEVIWTLDADEVPAFEGVKERLDKPFDELEVYKEEEGVMDGVTGIALRVQSEDGTEIVIFQRITPNYVLKSKRKYTLTFDGVNFGELESPSAFQVSRDNHVFYFGDTLYVLKQKPFEALFDYQSKKESIASAKLNEIAIKYANNLILPEGKTLESILAGDKIAINKLQTLESTTVLSRSLLTRLHLSFSSPVKIDAETGKMKIEDRADVKELIHILNDGYLGSEATNQRYTVNSKKKVVSRER